MKNTYQIILLVIINTMMFLSIHAEEKSIVKLSDGSSITGKIIVQRPGIDITVAAENASFAIDDNLIMSIKNKKVKYEDLDREWKRWALTEKKLQGDANGRFLVLCDVKTKKYTLTNVVKVENTKAPKVVYTNVVDNTYNINWKDINTIQKISDNQDNKAHVEDEVTTFSGQTYQGQIILQKLGNSISIKTKNGKYDLNLSEIAEIRKISSSNSYKINEIADYSNTVVLKDGTTKTGLMTVQHYGKSTKEQFITLLYNNGEKDNIQTEKITEYRTTYKNTLKKVYQPNSVYVNEFQIKNATTIIDGDNVFYVDKKVFPFPEGIVITFKSEGAKFQESWNLIALENIKMSNGSYTQGYTPKIKENNRIKPSVSDLTNNVSSISFNYLSPGFYALVNPNRKESYVIKIVK